MNIIYLLLPAALLLALAFVVMFIYAARHRQFDDLVTPAQKMLLSDNPPNKNHTESSPSNVDGTSTTHHENL